MLTSGDLELLTGPDAADLLQAAVDAEGELLSWAPRQVDHRPGAHTTVSYRARVRWGDDVRTETLAARTGTRSETDVPGAVRVGNGDREVLVWRFPVDPELPGLAAACDPEALAALLGSFGVEVEGLEVRVLSYRPGRRAVLSVATRAGALVIKAVRPRKIADLQARHRLLADAGVPVPGSLGWTDDGLLVMPRLAGSSLRDRLRTGATDLPAGGAVLSLLNRLPAEVNQLTRRPAWSENAGHYAAVLGAALPNQRDRVTDIANAVLGVVKHAPSAVVPTHGDLYEAQLLVHGPVITGLLDVDTVGPGARADDLACALAHLSVLTLMWSDRAPSIRRLGARWLAAFEREVDPFDLRHRVAGVLLSLATGPHRVQETGWQVATVRRLDLVEQWIESASATSNRSLTDEQAVTAVSGPPHLAG